MTSMPTRITEEFDKLLYDGDSEAARDFLAPYLAAGSAEASYLSSCIGTGEDEDSFEKRSHLAIQEAAARGYVPAVYDMGLCYLFGHHVEKDATAAAKCFSIASEAGYPAAMYELGLALFHGVGVVQDVSEALSLIRRSAAGGDEYAVEFLAAHDFRDE